MSLSQNFYTIYEPVEESEQEITGGPWCFAIDHRHAYLAFSSEELAKKFIHLWGSNNDGFDIIKIKNLGLGYEELLENVNHLLLLTREEEIMNLIKDIEQFPYNHFIIPRYNNMRH